MRIRPFLVLLALWLPATLFLGGDLGHWNDDFFFNTRDPATGRITAFVLTRVNPFDQPSSHVLAWRPLHHIFTPTVVSLLWDHARILHAFGALLHLANAVLLYRLLDRLGRTPQACLAAATLFVTCPIGFEVFLWAAAFSTCIATGLLLIAALAYLHHVRTASRAAFFTCVLAGILIPLFNDQPAALLAAFPFLALAARPSSSLPPGGGPGRGWRTTQPTHHASSFSLFAFRFALSPRALLPLALILPFHIVYVYLITKMPSHLTGSASSMTPFRDLPGHLGRIVAQVRENYQLKTTLGLGAIEQGLATITAHPLSALAFAAILLLAALVAKRTWLAHVDPATAGDQRRAGVRAIILFGLALAAAALIPLVAMRWTTVRPRMTYVITLGLLVAFAGMGDIAWSLAKRSAFLKRLYYPLAALPLACVLVFGIVALIGVQSAFQERQRADERGDAMLRDQLPNPPPGTFFLPVSVDNAVLKTRTPQFNWYAASPWYWSWAFPRYARLVYGRNDVHNGAREDAAATVRDANETSYYFHGGLDPATPGAGGGPQIYTWAQTVPIVVHANGSIELVSRLTIPRPNQPALTVDLPIVQAAIRERGVKAIEWTLVQP